MSDEQDSHSTKGNFAVNIMLTAAEPQRIGDQIENGDALAVAHASDARVRLFADSIPDIAWAGVGTPAGAQFLYFNARWKRITGADCPRNAAEFGQFIHPEDYAAAREKIESAMRTPRTHEAEWRLRVADGSFRWVLSRAIPSTNDPATAQWFGTITDIDDQHRMSESRDLLARELSHRIKNLFAVITGLISLRSRGRDDWEDFADEINDTIIALGKAQDFVRPFRLEKGESLTELLCLLMEPFSSRESNRVTIEGDDVQFGSGAATPLALIFHELGVNSAKYGALSAEEGRVTITVIDEDDAVVIRWKERGGPPVSSPSKQGFGTRLVHMAVTNQLSGAIHYDWQEAGLEIAIGVPKSLLERH